MNSGFKWARGIACAVAVVGLSGCIAAVTGASILANHAAVAALSDDVKADVAGEDILKMGNWNKTFERKDSSIFSSVSAWTCTRTPPAGGVCVPKGTSVSSSAIYGCSSQNGGYLYCKQSGAS